MLSAMTLMNYAAPEDRYLLVEWEKYLLPYLETGQIILCSEKHFLADQTDQSQFQNPFAPAKVIVLMLSNDFFANPACQAFMEEALRHYRTGQLIIVPLLLRPSSWTETDLAFLPCLPTDKRPIVEWDNQDSAFRHCALALRTPLLLRFFPVAIPPEQDQSHPQASFPTLVPLERDRSGSQAQTPSQMTRYYSCFISYAHQDEPFARSLYKDLLARGVPCWLAPHDLQVGAVFRQTIDDTIHKHEKLLLILSKHSIESAWTRDEVEAAMEFERKEGRTMLFPISLDTSFLTSDVAWVSTIRRAINVGFMNWSNPQTYAEGLEHLLQSLATKEPPLVMRPQPAPDWSVSGKDTPPIGERLIPGLTPRERYLIEKVINLQDEIFRDRTVLGVPKSEASTGLAVAGLVVGIVSIPLLCVYGVGLIVGIVGLFLSIFGMRNPSVRGIALAGLILSIVSILLGGGFIIFLYLAMTPHR